MARALAAHPKAEYTTATAPLAKANSLGHLQGESIHELLGRSEFPVRPGETIKQHATGCDQPGADIPTQCTEAAG